MQNNQYDHIKKNYFIQNQPRKTMFFNPRYWQSVKTNIKKKFLDLIDKHFKKENMKKVFNRNNCKVSYCCMESVISLISRHNKNVLSRANNKKEQEISTCNCRDKDFCPLNGKCLQENVVYKATITTQNESKEYFGSTGGPFKKSIVSHGLILEIHSYLNLKGVNVTLLM